jgi:hypothetical protein
VDRVHDRSQYDRPVGHGHGSRRRKVGGQRSLAPMDIAMLQRSAGNLAVTRLIGLQRAGAVPGVEPEPTTVPEVLRSSGRTLEAGVRAEMEQTLGADFSRVRVHSDTVAQRSAAEIGARAYTSGNHVVLGAGATDRHTLAHELWHVRQQSQGPVAGTDAGNGLSISDPHDRFEREAEMVADRAVRGHRAPARLDGQEAGGVSPGSRPVQRVFFGSSREADIGATMAARRRQRLDHEYGPLVGPHRVKEESELAEDGDVRLNPVWYRLENFPPGLLLDRGKSAVWCFSVGARGEILMGCEDITTVVEVVEWARLLTAMQEKDPTLTMDELQLRLNSSGHPTIAASFQSLGRTQVKPARVSGELLWNAELERFEINDKSGRYMSKKVRAGLQRADAVRWMTTVADRMTRHFGVPIGMANSKYGG